MTADLHARLVAAVQQPPCPFCEIVAGRAPATVVHDWHTFMAIVPLNPCTEGHTLVISRGHKTTADHFVVGDAMDLAGRLAKRLDIADYNLILNVGPAASQTIEHVHVHLVPRRVDDGLALPWPQRAVEVDRG